MIKRILLPLDPSPYSEAATDYAIQIAIETNAQIDGMVILDIPGIEKSVGAVAMGGLYWADKLEKKRAEEAHERVNSLLKKFKARCNEKNVEANETKYQGSPGACIIKNSIYYDMIVMGLRTYYKFETDDEPGNTLDKVLGHTITPILAVPDKYSSIENGNALIAFNGSLPAAKALQGFVQLAIKENINIRIINSSDNKEEGDTYLQQAKAYVKTYIDCEIETIWTPGDIIDVVNKDHRDWADLFVVGAHSKSGILDFMVGSLTKNLIEYGKKPVFIG